MEQRLTARAAAELAFRSTVPVKEIVLYRSGDAYPLCPQCDLPLEREHQRFCDRCGQRLEWKDYDRARILVRF